MVASGPTWLPLPCPRTESNRAEPATTDRHALPTAESPVTIAPAPSPARSLRRRILERGRDQAVAGPRGPRAARRHQAVPERQDRAARRRPRHPRRRLRVPRRPVGAGKSTLIKLLIRDEVATRGEVVLDGQDLARLPRRQVPRMRRKIGIIFQDFKLLPTKTVWENVAFALEVTGYPRRQIRPAVDRVLAIVGLTAQAKQTPTSCRVASSSGRRSPGRSSTTRG